MNARIKTHASTALAALALVAVAPGMLQAQEVDRRWLPWTGCWEVVGDQETSDVVCVEPGETPIEVRLVHTAEDVPDQVIRADGQPRPVSHNGCEGTEWARFSDDGMRIYTEGEYLCEDGVQQRSTGVLTLISGDEWVDIRSLEMEGERVAWVQRYVVGTPRSVQADEARDAITPQRVLARRMAARTPDVEDLLDVSRNVDAEVARTWVATVGQPFELDGRTLLALNEAGVDADVIDVAVAVSHPGHFNVGAEGALSERERTADRRAYAVGSPYGVGACFGSRSYFTPWGGVYGCASYYDPFFYGYGYGAPYYGYGYGGFYGGYWGGPTVIVVDRDNGSGGGGSAIGGRGYRGPRDNGPSGSSFAPPRSGGSGGGAVRGGGYTGGSRGGATTRGGGTRKAKPRGGGGGGI